MQKNTIDGYDVIQDEEEMVKYLQNGFGFAHWEGGDSMSPLLKDGEYVIIEPIKSISEVKQGDIVFCRLHDSDSWMTHMVWIKNEATNECLIGSTSGSLYGWTNDILGIGKRTKDRVIKNYNIF